MKRKTLYFLVIISFLCALGACSGSVVEEPTATMPMQVIGEQATPVPPPVRPQTPLPEVPVPEGAGLYVISDGLQGYINVQGEVVIEPGTYAEMVPVQEARSDGEEAWRAPDALRLLAVKPWMTQEDMSTESKGYALANARGEVKTGFDYLDFMAGDDGLVFARTPDDNYQVLLEQTGQPLLPGEYIKAAFFDGVLLLLSSGTLTFADGQGSVLAQLPGVSAFGTPGEGMLPVQNAEGYWGYAQLSTGQLLIEMRYDWALGFSEDVGCVGFASGEAGYIGVDGERAITETFQAARPFQNGMAVVRRVDDTGYSSLFIIDKRGKAYNKTGFDALANFIRGNTMTVGERLERLSKEGHVGIQRYFLLARDGSEIPLPQDTVAVTALAADRYLLTMMTEGVTHMGMMDGECNWLLRPEVYASLRTTQYPLHLFALEHGAAQWKLFDLNGTELMAGFDELISSDGRLVYCGKDGKNGYINMTGEWVYPR